MSPTPGHRRARRPSRPPTAGRRPTRRSRRATAIPVEPDPAVRPEHLARPAAMLAGDARRGPLRDAACPSTRPRTTGGSSTRPRRATASTADEVLVGRGRGRDPRHVRARRSCRPARRAVIPIPTYAMYRVLTEQRGGRGHRRPAPGAAEGWAIDIPAVRAAARERRRSSGCAARTTRPAAPSPTARSSAARRASPTDAAADATRPRRSSSSTRPMPSSSDASLIAAPHRYPNLVVVRTASKAYALAGLRVGFAVARARDDRPDRAVPAAGLDRRRSRPPSSPRRSETPDMRGERRPRRAPSGPGWPPRSREVGWDPQPERRPTSCSLDLGDRRARGGGRDRAAAPRPRAADVRRTAIRSPHCLRADGPRPRRERAAASRPLEIADPADPDRRRRPPHDHAARHARRPGARGPPRHASPGAPARPTSRSRSTSTAPGTPTIATGVGFYDHLLGSLAHHGLFDLEIRRDRRPRGRRAPHGRGRRARAGRGVRGGARRPGRDPPLRRQQRADGRERRDGGHRHRRAAVRRHRPAVPRRARGPAPAPARGPRPRVVRPDRGRDAPPPRHRAATTTTSPRRRSRRSAGRSAIACEPDPRRTGVASTKGSLG